MIGTSLTGISESIHEILRYIHCVLASGTEVSVPLGCESYRFESLARYEASQASQAKGALPETSFAAVGDPGAIVAYRTLLEKTWGPNEPVPQVPVGDYRAMLDYLDNVPAVVQAYVGRWILGQHEQLKITGKLASGTVLLVDRPLIYMCDNTQSWLDKQIWLDKLLGLTALRASQWRTQMNSKQSVLGIGVRIMGQDREYVLHLGSQGTLPTDLSRSFQWTFGEANFRHFSDTSVECWQK